MFWHKTLIHVNDYQTNYFYASQDNVRGVKFSVTVKQLLLRSPAAKPRYHGQLKIFTWLSRFYIAIQLLLKTISQDHQREKGS